MKRVAIILAWLALAALAGAQQSPPTQQNQAGSASSPQGAAQPPLPGKRPPQAKTQAEFDAFNAAKAKGNDAGALEKAADDFAAKFPDSELRILLYEAAMQSYQQANNGDKMGEMGRKVLTLDPDQPDALINVAEVVVEHTRDTDLDKDQRFDEAYKTAQHALQTVDTDLSIPAGTPQDKIDAYKGYLRSSAYSVLGTLQFNREKYSEAENFYRKAIDAFPSQPDPIVVLRLALALDKEEKYPAALEQANRAVQLTQEGTTAGTYARRERDRLTQLTGGSAPAKPAGTTPNPAPPKN
jgi:tetratricopeptide (TPR) repeat protein